MSNDNKKDPKLTVQDNSKPAESSTEDKIAAAVAKAIAETMPVAQMASAKLLADHLRPPGPTREQIGAAREHCTECGQLKRACRGEHIQMYVGPHNQRRFRSFPGLYTNGIWYKSHRYGSKITVPAENDFGYRIHIWENAEEDLYSGRTLSHNSGTLSGTGKSNIRHANPIGFSGLA